MYDKIPGTELDLPPGKEKEVFSVIKPILDATGGLTLSQLSSLTGLEGSTIQNWIKRGWVAAAKGKKYQERQVVRILLLNVLRGSLKLEDIASLMEYVNGRVDDYSDDIMHDTQLYDLMCRIIFLTGRSGTDGREQLLGLIEESIPEEYTGEDRRRLIKVLLIAVLGCKASYYRQLAEKEYKNLSFEKSEVLL